jgi:glucosylceramidase
MALDEENGPFVPGFGISTCRGIVRIEQKTKGLTYTLDYYALAHFSKFVQLKAVRIASTSDEVIRSVAFKNPDDSIVTILFNDTDKMKTVQIMKQGQELLHCNLPAKGAMTILKK